MEHHIYLDGMKKVLKKRGMTYMDLAQSLRMTESGVKKMLNAKDISFRRIIKICKLVDVRPSQLFALSEKSTLPTLNLTDKQQEALIKDRRLLAAYWVFTVERKTVEQIAAIQKASVVEIKSLLQKLVTLELISQKKNQFQPKHQGKFRWSDESRLAQVLNQEWSQLTLRKALQSAEKGRHRFGALKMSPESYEKLLQKFSDTLDEAALRSEREEVDLPTKSLIDFTIVFASTRGGVFSFE